MSANESQQARRTLNDLRPTESARVASVQADLTALTRELAERLLDGALRDMEAALFEQVADRLREELPDLIDRVLRERLLSDD